MKRILPISLLLLVAAPAGAQNLLRNPEFDVNTRSWSIFTSNDATGGFSTNDATRSSSSGSMTINQPSPNSNLAFQCVDVSPSMPWDASVATEIIGGGGVSFRLQWSDVPDCENGGEELIVAEAEGPISWTTIGGMGVSPANAVSALVLFRAGSLGASTFFFDDVVLALPEPDGGGLAAIVSLALVAGGRRRRRQSSEPPGSSCDSSTPVTPTSHTRSRRAAISHHIDPLLSALVVIGQHRIAASCSYAHAGFYSHLGLALEALDRNGEAVVAFERCLEIDPQFPDAENVRRELEAAQGLAGSNFG